MRTEQLLFWVAVGIYGVSAFCYIMGFIAKGEKLLLAGLWAAVAGFLPHTASIGVRWSEGATPFISTAESLSLGVWVTVLFYVVLQLANSRVRPLGVMVMPVAFVLIGAALGLLYLLKERGQGGLYERLPDLPALDALSYRFVVGGFTLYGVMIVSGGFWANQVKGTFWNWDPVEVWSLVSWLIYGIYLHLRITFGWRGRRLALYSLAAAAAMIVSYWGIPFTVETFHSGFRIEH